MLIEYNAGTAGGKRADRIAKLTGSLARGSGSGGSKNDMKAHVRLGQ
jgi:hypothetical protein